ncbi:hypothetical protein [Aestuariivirga sp.]|uniref:hypothetical protein n=1 Tax=Aestuariivirga sp. TaxID=2650926 RepID=UPI0035941DCC
MNLHNVSRHGRIFVRGEMLAIQAKLAFAMRRTALVALALVLLALGLILINIGLYAYLTPLWGPVWAPAGLGFINVGLAGLALLVAAIMKPGPELAMAEELRNTAGDALEAEVRSASFVGSLAGGFDRAGMSSLVLPAITAIIGALAKRRQAKE